MPDRDAPAFPANLWWAHAEALRANGYDLVPLPYGLKRPIIEGWPRADFRAHKGNVGDGAGIRTRNFPAFDVDILDAALALDVCEALHELLPDGARLVRVGRPPKFVMPCRLEGKPFAKRLLTLADGRGVIELLADGQQFVALNVHPDGWRYTWHGGSPLDTPASRLPPLSAARADAILAALAERFGGVASSAERSSVRVHHGDAKCGTRCPSTWRGASPEELAAFAALTAYLDAAGVLLGPGRRGVSFRVICPWHAEHTMGGARGQEAALWAPSGGFPRGGFRCLHAHCAGRNIGHFLRWVEQGIANGSR